MFVCHSFTAKLIHVIFDTEIVGESRSAIGNFYIRKTFHSFDYSLDRKKFKQAKANTYSK